MSLASDNPPSVSRKAARVAGAYLVFATLWIFASDRLLTLALNDPELLTRISTAKGFAFVAVTSLLLYLLLRLWDDTHTASGAPPSLAPRLGKPVALFLGLLLIVPLIAFSIVRLHGPHLRADAFASLNAVASLKAGQIESWLAERRGDAEVLADAQGLAVAAERLVLTGNPASRTFVAHRLETFRKAKGFDSALLLNASGQTVLAVGADVDAPALVKQQLLPTALASGQVQRSELYRDAADHVHLDYVVPLPGSAGNPRNTVAAVVLHAPVERFLFPLIQTWPTPSRSAETLLARRDGDKVLFLNELRHRRGTALSLSLPLDDPSRPVVAAVLGGKSLSMEGYDYRGVAVFAASRPIAGTAWHLVAKIDREEVMAPLDLLIFWVSLVAFVAVSAIAATMLLLWRQTLLAHRLELGAQATAILRASEAKYRRLHESMRDAFAMTDMSGRLIDFNQAFREMTGYSAEELQKLTYLDLTPEKWRESEVCILNEQVLVHGHSPIYEKEYLRKDGTVFPVELKTSLIRDENGHPEAMWAIVRDITERKRTEHQLQESEKRYRQLFHALVTGFALHEIICDKSGKPVDYRFLEINPAFATLTGFNPEKLIGRTILESYPDTEPFWIERYGRVALTGEPAHFTEYSRVIDKYFEITAYSPQRGQFAVTFQDVTERKQAEAALVASEATYHSLFSNMLNSVAHCRMIFQDGIPADFEYLAVNPGFEQMTGLQGVAGKNVSEVIPGYCRDNPESLEVFGRVAMTGVSTHWEHYLAALDRWFSFSIYSPAHGEFVAVGDDISARKKAEAEIRQLNAALEKKVAERTAQLKAINQELETFTYSVSHDLKAPLRGIDGYSRLLQEDHAAALNQEGQTFVANIRHGAQQMSQLIEDLLAYSRLERRALQTARIAPGNVADAVVAEFAEEIQTRHVAVTVNIPGLEVRADVDGLAMILRNLLGNALKFTRDTPRPAIEIGGREAAESCMVWVRDNGIGFDMKFHERIFEIFQRLQRAEDYPGTGIGLAIVRKAAQRMGGRVWAESTPGSGAAFFVELPK